MSSGPGSLIFTIQKTHSPEKVLEKDDNGYYKVILGALNCRNSSGEFYVAEGVKELMQDPSSLIYKRLQSGYLVGEMGHPQFQPGMTKADYIMRMFRIAQDNTSHHIKSVEFQPGQNGMVKMLGWVKPAGPKGDLLKESLDNPDRNTAFSIRSITGDYVEKGQTIKKILQIITWDWVELPGIQTANAWDTMSTESYDIIRFTSKDLEELASSLKTESIGLEDNNIVSALNILNSSIRQEVNCNDTLNRW